MILKGKGRIYKDSGEQPFADVNYQLFVEENGWQGELILTRKDIIRDGEVFLLEIDDGRRGKCALRKKVNKAVMGMPVRYFFALNGIGVLE